MRALLVSLCAALLFGCTSASPLPPEWPSRLFLSPSIRERVELTSLRDILLEDGNTQLVAAGRSLKGPALRVRYRAIWFDSAGSPIDTTLSSWSHRTLERDRPFELKMTGPGRRAESWRVEIETDEIVEGP